MAANEPPYQVWLKETKEKYPDHVQGGRLERFAAVVKSNPVFQSIYQTAIDGNENVYQPDGSLDEVDGLPATSVKTQPIPADKNNFNFYVRQPDGAAVRY